MCGKCVRQIHPSISLYSKWTWLMDKLLVRRYNRCMRQKKERGRKLRSITTLCDYAICSGEEYTQWLIEEITQVRASDRKRRLAANKTITNGRKWLHRGKKTCYFGNVQQMARIRHYLFLSPSLLCPLQPPRY